MATKNAPKIGWIGMGRMGFPMAERLIKAGHDVSIWNRTRAKAEPLIQIQAAPWSVAIQVQAPTSTSLCTGSIVNASFIVTAAHCLFDAAGTIAKPSQLTVEAGVSNFDRPLATDAEQERTVRSFAVDPGYAWSGQVMPDDVAVLALSSPLDLTGPAVHAVALPTPDGLFPTGAAVALAGFGEATPGIFPTGPLESMTATIDAQGTCGATSAGGVLPDDTIRLCASAPNSAACNGDSGAGLVTTGASPTLVGVVSGAPLGCVAGTHTIFTYVGADEILGFLQRWAQSGTAIVIVEQHVRLSLSVATRIMTLERGQIVRTSEPGEFAATLAERRNDAAEFFVQFDWRPGHALGPLGRVLEIANDLQRHVRGDGPLHAHLDLHIVRRIERLFLDALGLDLWADNYQGHGGQQDARHAMNDSHG